jgi:XapX domain-containing protein
MKAYVFSLSAGLLVGVIYSLMRIKSPAPPLIALVGLFGMVIGERLLPVATTVLHRGVRIDSAGRGGEAAKIGADDLDVRNQKRCEGP